MQVNSATDVYGGSSAAAKQQGTSLDKDAFLRLFVEQLKNQDPSSPQDASTMMNQMTQFSILEQLTNISTAITEMKLSQQTEEASALLGRQVTVQTSEGEVSGQVEKAVLSDGEVRIYIDGVGYGMEQVIEIK